jgi:hypothetical protein
LARHRRLALNGDRQRSPHFGKDKLVGRMMILPLGVYEQVQALVIAKQG